MAYKWFEHISESVKGKSNLQLKNELSVELQSFGIEPFSIDFDRKKCRCELYWTYENKPNEATRATIAEIFTRLHDAWKLSRIEENVSYPGGFRMIFNDITP